MKCRNLIHCILSPDVPLTVVQFVIILLLILYIMEG